MSECQRSFSPLLLHFSRFMQSSVRRPDGPPMLFPSGKTVCTVSGWAAIIGEYGPSEDCTVTKVKYFKCAKAKQHEFLVVQATHKTSGALVILATDRTGRREEENESSAGMKRESFAIASSSLVPANNRIILSYDGTEECVTRQIKGRSNSLATLDYSSSSSPPTILQLSVILDVVRLSEPKYGLYRGQCYWYASAVWNVLCELFPPIKREPVPGASSYYGIPIPQRDSTPFIVEAYNAQWKKLTKKAEDRRMERELLDQEVSRYLRPTVTYDLTLRSS
jgi:hypothetical protein